MGQQFAEFVCPNDRKALLQRMRIQNKGKFIKKECVKREEQFHVTEKNSR